MHGLEYIHSDLAQSIRKVDLVLLEHTQADGLSHLWILNSDVANRTWPISRITGTIPYQYHTIPYHTRYGSSTLYAVLYSHPDIAAGTQSE
eukprot:scaffold13527_cov202-Amphora_coffeaeformis.AAC.3